MKRRPPKSAKRKRQISVDQNWEVIHPNAAGIDIGSREHWVCVPARSATPNVRRFGTLTGDLESLADWLKECGVIHVAMEATGVYWIALFQILEKRGLQVLLVNPRQTKHVAGRKTDVQDCQWIQRLHTYGLLEGSFRPADPYCVLRTYLRYRDELVAMRTVQTQHMHKALQQMNVQLVQVLSDVTGVSGLAIIEAILQGERDPVRLAGLVDKRVRAQRSTIAKALQGDYRTEHLFVLKQAWEQYLGLNARIQVCEERIVGEAASLPDQLKVPRPLPERKKGRPASMDQMQGQDMRPVLFGKLGTDLTSIESIGVSTALVVLSEVGPDLSRFKSEKHFSSWLGLCPDNRISGGKVLSSRTRRVVNRLANALRMAAVTLERSQSALGGYYRKMKARLGAAEGITATAHKLARLIYRLIKHGEDYVRQGLEDYETKYRDRKLKALQRSAQHMGFTLVASQQLAPPVS